MWDIAIVGGGPAGLSAAINARQRGRRALVLASASQKGWLHRAERIENYPGLFGVSGMSLLDTLQQQARSMGAEFQEGLVRQILPMGVDSFSMALENDYVEARRVIIATGARQPTLLPGEEELLGRGVSYCATCDGMLFRGKRVGVLGASAHAAQEAAYLANLAGEVLFFGQAAALDPRVTRMPGRITAVLGGDRVTGVAAGDEIHALDGLFILRDAVALSALLPGLAHEGPFIRVDRHMRTNIGGIFAAGDCTGTPLQVAKAVGEGCIAALSASE